LQIEPDILNRTIDFELAQAVKKAKCFGSIEDDRTSKEPWIE